MTTDAPLVQDDPAHRLDRAAARALTILMQARRAEGDAFEDVRRSRYMAVVLDSLADELLAWQPKTPGGAVLGERDGGSP